LNETAKQFKEYLTSLWFDESYPDSDQTKGIPAPSVVKTIPPDAELIDLTPIENLNTLCIQTTFESLIGRKSIRNFDKKYSITKDELSYLLFCTQGVKDKEKPTIRISPTGGAKCSIETYIFIDKAQGIESGLYLFLPVQHKLMKIHNKTLEEFKKCLYSGNYFYSPITFIWTAIPYRLEWKYVERAYKILLLDAGHTCQNLYIACQSIGLGTCAVGAYRQHEMDMFLQVDGEKEFTVYCAPVGKKK
jgi:SagB-type dehydrogenase family enzyme